MGWNGFSRTLRYPSSNDLSQWGSFYWDGINRGKTIVSALAYAIANMIGSFGFHSDDTDRLYTFGDDNIP